MNAIPYRRLWELAGVLLALAAVAVALYGNHTVHGGFLSDAWTNLSLFEFAPGSGAMDALSYYLSYPHISVRPLQAVYLVALFEAFGANADLWLGWQVATNVVMCGLLFALLRRLSVAPFDAAVVAVLVLIFPAASSLRFWTATIWAPLSISMVIGGFLLALSAFEAKGVRRRLTRHALSLLLFVASLLLYEVTLLVMLASVLVYRLGVPWRTAARRWLVDCAVLVSIVFTVTRSSSWQEGTEMGAWRHGVEILEGALELLATVILPFEEAHWYVFLVIALMLAVSFMVCCRLAKSDPVRVDLRRWLIAACGGFVVVGLGNAVYAPGIDYYNPMTPGVGDRVNAVASIGWVLALYALARLAFTLALRRLPRQRVLSSALAALACGLIAVNRVKIVSEYSDAYVRAYDENVRVLEAIDEAIPRPRPHSMIWTFGQPVEIRPGVPVFGSTPDMTSSVRLLYGDPTVLSNVGFPGTTFACRADAIAPGNHPRYPPVSPARRDRYVSEYGRTYFVNTVAGRAKLIQTPGDCRRAARRFPRSPHLAGEPPLRTVEAAPGPPYRLTAGGGALIGPQRHSISVKAGKIIGFVDNVDLTDGMVTLAGWAAASASSPARLAIAVVGTRSLAQVEPSLVRSDVATTYGTEAIERSGFVLSIEAATLDCEVAAGGVTVFALSGGVASPLTFAGNSEEGLESACR